MGKGLVNFTNHSQFPYITMYNHPNWYILAKLPNNPDSKAVSLVMTSWNVLSLISAPILIGPSLISAL